MGVAGSYSNAMEARYAPRAIKDLRALPRPDAERIRRKVGLLATDPEALANQVKALKGTDILRLRVGDYRVLFSEDGVILTVQRVRHRREAYR